MAKKSFALVNPPDIGALDPELDPPINLLMIARCLEESLDVSIFLKLTQE